MRRRASVASRFQLALLACGLLSACLVAAPGAAAATVTYGSDLKATASQAFPSPYDIAFWPTAFSNGQPVTAPVSGQVTDIKLKGCAEVSRTNQGAMPPYIEAHFQTLHPQGGTTVVVQKTTQPFFFKVCGQGADQNTINDFAPLNLCVAQGDYVSFNDSGGFDGNATSYPYGVYYDVFAPSSAAGTLFYHAPDQTNNGFTLTGRPATVGGFYAADQPQSPPGSSSDPLAGSPLELLMRATVGTGPDGVWLCAGGTRGAPPPAEDPGPPTTVPGSQHDGVSARGKVKVSLYCHTRRPCSGSITLDDPAAARKAGAAEHLALSRFQIPGRKTAKVPLRIGRTVIRKARRSHGRMKVAVTVASDPGGPANTFTGAITLTVPVR